MIVHSCGEPRMMGDECACWRHGSFLVDETVCGSELEDLPEEFGGELVDSAPLQGGRDGQHGVCGNKWEHDSTTWTGNDGPQFALLSRETSQRPPDGPENEAMEDGRPRRTSIFGFTSGYEATSGSKSFERGAAQAASDESESRKRLRVLTRRQGRITVSPTQESSFISLKLPTNGGRWEVGGGRWESRGVVTNFVGSENVPTKS
ncbi:hypothetical protein PLEOSDRAFT_1087156 [Pleurotus ostreatus PC15]|uniref:Uncharacterized protein n=1 Tax=Pleurotus ostreatus (strain PC15) TaxID=1137138 RepID=A0A067N6F7_PLEO1|nr:hypothetical protein PLEOSDRAFT_1087156 [Pleurotus ostreatus PC15]